MIRRTRLYELRHQWLIHKDAFGLDPSGGDHRPDWPAAAHTFLAEFLPHCQPLNFALLADELARRLDFHRSRAAVAAYVRQHFPKSLPTPKRGPKPRRRWQCAALGELWQHDSSPHPWWPAESYPTLILTLADHSRKIVAATFAPSDTTWSHFVHLRSALEQHGLPAALYTDGLSLFGHRSPADRLDTHSQFQRAFTALGAAHRVAPDAQAKGKIERRFDTFQKRLVSLLSFERVTDYQNANALLQTQIAWHNQPQPCRTTGLTPNAAWNLALQEKRNHHRPTPAVPLLDLHLALYHQRRLNADFTLDFPRKKLARDAGRLQDRHARPPSGTTLLDYPSAPRAQKPSLARRAGPPPPLNPSPVLFQQFVRFCSNIFSAFERLPTSPEKRVESNYARA